MPCSSPVGAPRSRPRQTRSRSTSGTDGAQIRDGLPDIGQRQGRDRLELQMEREAADRGIPDRVERLPGRKVDHRIGHPFQRVEERRARVAHNACDVPPGAVLDPETAAERIGRRSEWTASAASPRPQAPPIQVMSRLSARNCLTRRMRPDPSATRIAASRARPDERPSHNVAMFMHAISSRHPTAPATTTSVSRTVRVLSACGQATSTSKSAVFRA